SGRIRDAIASGAMVAWAASSVPYYGVYCLMIAAVYVVDTLLVITPRPAVPGRPRTHVAIEVGIALVIALIVVVHILAGGTLRLGPVSIAMRSLYTPMLVLTVLVLVRLLWPLPRISWRPLPRGVVQTGAILGGTAAVALAPEIYALVQMAAGGGLVRAPVPWRSSAPGVDLVSF